MSSMPSLKVGWNKTSVGEVGMTQERVHDYINHEFTNFWINNLETHGPFC